MRPAVLVLAAATRLLATALAVPAPAPEQRQPQAPLALPPRVGPASDAGWPASAPAPAHRSAAGGRLGVHALDDDDDTATDYGDSEEEEGEGDEDEDEADAYGYGYDAVGAGDASAHGPHAGGQAQTQAAAPSARPHAPGQTAAHAQAQALRRPLHGRFLHVTDMHPDPWYAPGVSRKHACHRAKKKPKKGKPTGFYGTPFGDCDSPLRLTNHTLDFLGKNWADEIDFVVWTGDNARHDNDRKHPRTTTEIYQLNRQVARKMQDVFASKGIPVVPSLGNNDVWPHNIMSPGPNSITNEFSSIWHQFIPFHSYQIFQRGAYFTVEVIPNAIAVVSLNTMYFYDSNKAVGGCEFPDKDDPGNLQFDWLEVQLEAFRERRMKVYLTGHVPPSPGNYFSECYVRYVELSLRFQDTILGHLYGHMNADHFFLLEAEDLQLPAEDAASAPHTAASADLFAALMDDFGALPKTSKTDYDDYAVVNVNPSVVPNPYTPGFRIYAYNITGAPRLLAGEAPDDALDVVARATSEPTDEEALSEGRPVARGGARTATGEMHSLTPPVSRSGDATAEEKRKHGHQRGNKGDKTKECKKGTWRDTWRCRLTKPWHSDPEAPARTNTLWTPLGYAQYYIPKLEAAKKGRRPEYKLEYLTFRPERLHPPVEPPAGEAKPGPAFDYPVPLRHLPASLRDANVTASKFAPYEMEDLTVAAWVKLARGLGEKKGHLRKRFRGYMVLGGG